MFNLLKSNSIKIPQNRYYCRLFFMLLFAAIAGCQPEIEVTSDVDREISPPPETVRTIDSPVEYLGQMKLPTGFTFEGTEIGGLSGITYDPSNNVYYAVSDDRSLKSDARFYTFKIAIDPTVEVTPVKVTKVLTAEGQPFPPYEVDLEGISLSKNNTLFLSSEGDNERSLPPFITEFSLAGKPISSLPIPSHFLAEPKIQKGIRNNLALESLTVSPNALVLYSATENALAQDGPEPTAKEGTRSRILQYNLKTSQPEKEFLYVTERVLAEPQSPDDFHMNGLVDLLAIDDTKLLSLERGFTQEIGNTILLYEVSLKDATDISEIEDLGDRDTNNIKPAEKRLLLDLRSLDLPLDNIEGMTFGPTLPDGRRSLILVSDNNFHPLQVTQFLVFAIDLEE